MAASHRFQNAGFVCGLQSEARCLAAAGIDGRIAVSGARAAQATGMARELLAAGAESLVSIGLAGGLDPRLGPGAVVVADRVFAWHRPLPKRTRRSVRQSLGDLTRGTIPTEDELASDATADSQTEFEFAADPEMRTELLAVLGDKTWSGAVVSVNQAVRAPDQKLGLFVQTTALACDMESHAVAEAARRADVPFVVLRIVSDPSNRFIPETALEGLDATGGVSPGDVLRGVAVRPWEVIELLTLALDARIAFGALRSVARRSAPLFRTVR